MMAAENGTARFNPFESVLTYEDTPFIPNAALVRQLGGVYEKLIKDCPIARGKELSAKERELKGLRATTLVYGEINFAPYASALFKIKELYGGLASPGGKFYDIGSGTGKPVFAAALLHPWASCTGIELLEGLHEASLQLLDRWHSKEMMDVLPEAAKEVSVRFVLGDFTKVDWSDADVIFANSTCFDEYLMKDLARAAASMAVGTFAITFTKKLPSSKWKVLESHVETMTWGAATVFIQTKVIA